MDNSFERRVLHAELRTVDSSDVLSIEGRAVPYGVMSSNLGGFRERIQRGAFAKVLRSKPDVLALFNHDPSKVLGRTTSGTLTLRDASDGLHFSCTLPNNSIGRDLHESIKRGDINGCSFSFPVNSVEQDWDEDDDPEERGKRIAVRTITSFSRLIDLGPVTMPAYGQGTSVDARSLGAIVLATPPGELRYQAPEEARKVEIHNDPVETSRQRRRDLLNQILS